MVHRAPLNGVLLHKAGALIDARRQRFHLLALHLVLDGFVALFVVLGVRDFGGVWLVVTFDLMLAHINFALAEDERPHRIAHLLLIT